MAKPPRRSVSRQVRYVRRATGQRVKGPPAADRAVRDWLVARVRSTYASGNWAGKGALPSIKGVAAEVAHRRHPAQHTIAEIVLHMAYWKDAVTARLRDQPWSLDESLNWRAAGPGEAGWVAAREELAAAQKRLVAALRAFTPDRMLERIRGRLRLIDVVTDIATHDTYHAAQIFVLRRLAAQERSPEGRFSPD